MSKKPIHPGELIEPLILIPCGCSQSQLARQLGFKQPQPVNELIRGRRSITAKMALLFERLTQSRYPAEFWLLAQLRWDLSMARGHLPPARASLVQPVELPATTDSQSADTAALLHLAAELSQTLASS